MDPTAPDISVAGRPLPSWLAPLSLVGLLFLLALPGLDRPVHNMIEAVRIACAQSMVEDGHWLIPRTWGTPYILKPPLTPWLIAVVGSLAGGVNEVTARLAITFTSASGLVFLWYLTRRSLGAHTAWVACLILATGYDFGHRVGYALIDLPLMLAIACALWSFYLGLHDEERRRAAFAWFHVWGTIAFLLKGPLALALVAAVVLPYLVVVRRLGIVVTLLRSRLALLWLLPVGWYAAALLLAPGDTYTTFTTELTQQIAGHNEREPPLWYLNTLAGHFFPWGILLPVTAWPALRERRQPALFALVWGCATFVLFSLSAEKTHRYLMPIYPALAVWTALGLARAGVWVDRAVAAVSAFTAAAAGVAALAVATARWWLHGETANATRAFYLTAASHHTPLLVAAMAGLAATAAYGAIAAWHGRPVVAAILLALALGLVQGPGYWRLLDLPGSDPRHDLTELRALLGEDGIVGKYRWHERDLAAVPYYLRQTPAEPQSPEAAAAFLAQPHAFLLTPRPVWDDLATTLPEARVVLAFPFQPNKGRLQEIVVVASGEAPMGIRGNGSGEPPPESVTEQSPTDS